MKLLENELTLPIEKMPVLTNEMEDKNTYYMLHNAANLLHGIISIKIDGELIYIAK